MACLCWSFAQHAWENNVSSSFWEDNVSGPNVYPHIDFALIGKQSKHARKKTFWILKIVFLQSLSFLQVIGENNVSGSQVYPHIDLEWMGSSPSMPDKNNFLELGNCFSAKPKFSSSFLGKTMFQVPKSIHI